MPSPQRPPDAARCDTGQPRKVSRLAARTVEPLSWKLAVGLMANPRGTNGVPFSGVRPAGSKKIVLASSALAASPAKGLLSPQACCSLSAGVTRPEDRRRSEPGQRPADVGGPPTTAHSARSL